jgi:hypothetical protein
MSSNVINSSRPWAFQGRFIGTTHLCRLWGCLRAASAPSVFAMDPTQSQVVQDLAFRLCISLQPNADSNISHLAQPYWLGRCSPCGERLLLICPNYRYWWLPGCMVSWVRRPSDVAFELSDFSSRHVCGSINTITPSAQIRCWWKVSDSGTRQFLLCITLSLLPRYKPLWVLGSYGFRLLTACRPGCLRIVGLYVPILCIISNAVSVLWKPYMQYWFPNTSTTTWLRISVIWNPWRRLHRTCVYYWNLI